MALLLFVVTVQAQNNFTYTPENPKPGDVITFSYDPGGDLAGIMALPDAVAYQLGSKTIATDIDLKRSNKRLQGSVQTDTSANFVFFSFSVDKKFDNNDGKGFYIQLQDGDKARKGSNVSKAVFYEYYGQQAGVERNSELALKSYEKEFELYPDSKKANLTSYLRTFNAVKKDEGPAAIQKEIEAALKAGLKTEADYTALSSLYSIAKLPQQAKFITDQKKEKYPNGSWTIGETINKFMAEKDIAKKEAQFAEISNKIATDPDWKIYEGNLSYFQQQVIMAYMKNKDWKGMQAAIDKATFKTESERASLYNSLAWEMQKTEGADLALAERLSRTAVEITDKNRKDATMANKPLSMTKKQWAKNTNSTYGMFADTYAMVLYRKGDYKKGLPYANESAMVLGEGKDADLNNTYALLASKALSKKKAKEVLEKFVKEGKATGEIKELLKESYVKDKKSEKGYEEYITMLEKEAYTKMVAELKKSMLSETAPSFALYNFDGKKTDIADLKGKVVVLDFWATWCGPCIASFPGMKKAQDKYKDNPNVKFVFIDTWETVPDKKKNAQDFMTEKKYDFDVWMDTEDKVVSAFKVDGIPTKFILDKDGVIRFKSVGFSGDDDKLVEELSVMIDIAGSAEKKAF